MNFKKTYSRYIREWSISNNYPEEEDDFEEQWIRVNDYEEWERTVRNTWLFKRSGFEFTPKHDTTTGKLISVTAKITGKISKRTVGWWTPNGGRILLPNQ